MQPLQYGKFSKQNADGVSSAFTLCSKLFLLYNDANARLICVLITVCLCSRQAGHIELAERLVECQYELTDRLAFYLCGRRPGKTLPLFVSTSHILVLCTTTQWSRVIVFTHFLCFTLLRSQEWPLYHPSNGRQVWTMTLFVTLFVISVRCLYAWCDLTAWNNFISILGLCSYLPFDTPMMVSVQCVYLRDYVYLGAV